MEVSGSANLAGYESLSSISTFVLPGATGQGGDLTLQTQNLQVAAGGTVSTNTFDAGNAGKLTVQAADISLSGNRRWTLLRVVCFRPFSLEQLAMVAT